MMKRICTRSKFQERFFNHEITKYNRQCTWFMSNKTIYNPIDQGYLHKLKVPTPSSKNFPSPDKNWQCTQCGVHHACLSNLQSNWSTIFSPAHNSNCLKQEFYITNLKHKTSDSWTELPSLNEALPENNENTSCGKQQCWTNSEQKAIQQSKMKTAEHASITGSVWHVQLQS